MSHFKIHVDNAFYRTFISPQFMCRTKIRNSSSESSCSVGQVNLASIELLSSEGGPLSVPGLLEDFLRVELIAGGLPLPFLLLVEHQLLHTCLGEKDCQKQWLTGRDAHQPKFIV